MTEGAPRPDHRNPFRLPPSEQLLRLWEANERLFAHLADSGRDLDTPIMPLAHMETGKHLAEVVIRASTLLADLGLDPEFIINLKIAELQQNGTRGT